jgi:hypothetical protein
MNEAGIKKLIDEGEGISVEFAVKIVDDRGIESLKVMEVD